MRTLLLRAVGFVLFATSLGSAASLASAQDVIPLYQGTLYAFTLMRALAKGLDASPWVPQIPNHQRIVDAIRMGNPRLAEQVVIHITNHFMERYLEG